MTTYRYPHDEPADMGETDPTGHRLCYSPLMNAHDERRIEPWCACGWHEDNHPGFTVADHLADWT